MKSSSQKWSLGLLIVGACTVASLTVPSRNAEAGDKVDCSKLKDLKSFCESVDGKEASLKRVMKDAEKAYQAAGKGDIECKSCHQGSNGGELTGDTETLWPKYKPFVETAITNYKK